jgi:hypothetical protein
MPWDKPSTVRLASARRPDVATGPDEPAANTRSGGVRPQDEPNHHVGNGFDIADIADPMVDDKAVEGQLALIGGSVRGESLLEQIPSYWPTTF